jgi:hypothetical protein
MAKRDYREYWDRNIDKWSEIYLQLSHGHEQFAGPAWFAFLYNSTIWRLERKLMAERYTRTITFIDTYVKRNHTFRSWVRDWTLCGGSAAAWRDRQR